MSSGLYKQELVFLPQKVPVQPTKLWKYERIRLRGRRWTYLFALTENYQMGDKHEEQMESNGNLVVDQISNWLMEPWVETSYPLGIGHFEEHGPRHFES